MVFMQWSGELEVHNATVDGQHKQLVDALNELAEAVQAGRGAPKLQPTLDFLVIYADMHFSDEENLMRKGSYPDMEPHVAQHRSFIAKAEDLRAQAASGSATLDVELLDFLKDWLLNHIMKQTRPLRHLTPRTAVGIERRWHHSGGLGACPG